MKKLRLEPVDLKVETFDADTRSGTPKGTVYARWTVPPEETCDESCYGTCDWQWTCWGSQAPFECCA